MNKKSEDEMKDLLEKYLILARQTIAPSHIILQIQNDMKSMVKIQEELVMQARKTNGRVTRLEKFALIAGTTIIVLTMTKYPAITSLIHSF